MNRHQFEKFYFDYASTTPLDSGVFKAMKPYFFNNFGNAANLYKLGRDAKIAVENALDKISLVLGCLPEEFVFTGSATESDNLAIFGVARANREFGNKIIISNVEHKGIIAACKALKEEGFEICELKVDKNGLISSGDLKKNIDKKTILVSITYADNETGTIQPIREIAEIIKKFRIRSNRVLPYFHTDATQAASYLNLNVNSSVGGSSVDLMTLSAHKIYGPKGIGGLYIRKGTNIKAVIVGGGRELQSSTGNIPGIVGFGEALFLADKYRNSEFCRIKELRDKLQDGIIKLVPKVVLNGHPEKRLPNFLNVSILDVEGEAMLLHLDDKGISVGTGSACNSQSLKPSHIIAALGRPYEYIHGNLRFSLGKGVTDSSIKYVLRHLPEIVGKLRRISPMNLKIDG